MIGIGLLAGAAGTASLDIFTYLDMLVRGRPPSSVPSDVVQRMAKAVGVTPLASEDGPKPQHRRSGAGAIFGYGVGLGAGAVYAATRPAFKSWLPWPVAGVALGAATLGVSEGTATGLGATDWTKWTPSEWLMDLLPRTLYGLTVAYVVEKLSDALDESRIEGVIASEAIVVESVGLLDEVDPLTATDPLGVGSIGAVDDVSGSGMNSLGITDDAAVSGG